MSISFVTPRARQYRVSQLQNQIGINNQINNQINNNIPCNCFQQLKKPSTFNSDGNVQTYTQTSRIVNSIRYSTSGRTQFGYYVPPANTLPLDTEFLSNGTTNPQNANIITIARFNFIGRTEGQPGGLQAPLRNKF